MVFDPGNLITAPAVMAGMGLFFGVILAVASRVFRVKEDPRLLGTEELLPGTNCGACGEPGCAPFAEALIKGEVQPSGCTVASEDTVEAIAEFLGVDAGEQEKRVARLHCAGGQAQAFQIAEYRGFEGCRAAAVVSGGGKGCSWGCLGLADCEVACTFDVIYMNSNGLPEVDTVGCTACGDCVDACPRDLFEIIPLNQKLFVQCNTPLEGDAAVALCSVACDACGRCSSDAVPGLIEMLDNLPSIHYESGLPVTPAAINRCPTGAIQWLEGDQFHDRTTAETEEEIRYAQL
ncbi:RnfABCDGE type electron transport complex subunit B [Candidatus Vondammii sp. HM_W22]|uniref:RnfABCDGE type electron transport complex subunit B n=1 Tax=Candidatus Vondammii sp. HM_W22 TaxID=2687299 RepID=UPI001F13E332|nr:RnfABCDGE type electron transport complex subunit B [Candidatus Vondammii sp. HM_W22]